MKEILTLYLFIFCLQSSSDILPSEVCCANAKYSFGQIKENFGCKWEVICVQTDISILPVCAHQPVGTRSSPLPSSHHILPLKSSLQLRNEASLHIQLQSVPLSLNLCCGIPKWPNSCTVCSFPCFLLKQSPFVGIFCVMQAYQERKSSLPQHKNKALFPLCLKLFFLRWFYRDRSRFAITP